MSVPENDITKTEREISYFSKRQLDKYNELVNYYSHQIDYIEMGIYTQSVDWDEKYLICFEKGYIEVHLAPPLAANRCGTLKIYRESANGPETTIPSLPHEGPMLTQAKNFLRVARGEIAPLCPAREALFTLEVCKKYTQMTVV